MTPKDRLDIDQETALAMAQFQIFRTIKKSGKKRSEIAAAMGKPRNHISKMLSGDYDLTIKEFALVIAICGFETYVSTVEYEQWKNYEDI